ncbi:MAG: hypothetical protein HYR96_12025 [Deltaproteobacteria bacterium]|nr:hypothetical protein [Deltaproteobacteria bacterium]MBI3293783.1 hypothetical protein [Deltaproteobacteria bacterium]
MPRDKKLNLERFKKSSHGLVEFATLIEQADPTSQARILEQAKEQDEEFVFHVMKRIVYFDELVFLDEAVLAELLSKVSPKVLAFALVGANPEFRDKMLRNLSLRDRRTFEDEADKMGNANPAFTAGARKQILRAARRLEAENKFVFEVTAAPRHKKKAR